MHDRQPDIPGDESFGTGWYDGLAPMGFAEAAASLVDGDVVGTMRGMAHGRTTRRSALEMLSRSSRRAPVGQGAAWHGHRVVTLDDEGRPIQLQTRH